MRKNDWRYGKKRNGMYIDGHEREDVVAYRKEFIERWKGYEKRMVTYDNEGDVAVTPSGFPVSQTGRFRLILVTHDESTFYAHDRRKTGWQHSTDKATPERKGEGPSLMISDMLTADWGRLRDGDECVPIFLFYNQGTYQNVNSEARVVFKAGKNRDGWFSSEDLLAQVEKSIDIFESKTNGFATGLFMFDNAPSHQKRAADALSARKMPKRPHSTWTHHPSGPRMRDGVFDGHAQSLYHPETHPTMAGWFKGMETVIRERGLWPAGGLRAECSGFKCVRGETDCCCQRLMFSQPDFVAQRSQLDEYITSRGHICDFYPKFHCELNFIEQYWGAVKYRYRLSQKTRDMDEMERNVLACLDDVPLLQIKR